MNLCRSLLLSALSLWVMLIPARSQTAAAAPTSTPTAPAEGTAMDEAALLKKWQTPAPGTLPPGFRTRSITRPDQSAPAPQVRTRSISLIPIRVQDSIFLIQGHAVSEVTEAVVAANSARPLTNWSRTAGMLS